MTSRLVCHNYAHHVTQKKRVPLMSELPAARGAWEPSLGTGCFPAESAAGQSNGMRRARHNLHPPSGMDGGCRFR